MEILTVLFGCSIHITLILLFEGIFLFGILYPILKRVANRITEKYSNVMFSELINKGYNNLIYINEQNKLNFEDPINIFLKACSIDEKKYLKTQDNMPYIIFGILLFSLLIFGIFIFILSKYLNINIDYKFVIITSIISFALICGYAFMVLYYILGTQPYVLNITADIYKAILDIFNSV